MSEYPTIENPKEEQIPNENLLDNMSIRQFIELLRKSGLSEEAETLTDMCDSMSTMANEYNDMRKKVQELEEEVEQLRGDTPLTQQFKTEFRTRVTRLHLQLDDLSRRFLEAKDSLVASAKEGISNFVEVGKSALHQACAAMSQAGIHYFKNVIGNAEKGIEANENIISSLNEYAQANAQARQKRGNLVRSLFNIPQKAEVSVSENMFLHTLRNFTQMNIKQHNNNINASMTIISKLEAFRDKQKQALEKNPSFDNLLKNAQTRAEQMKDNIKDAVKDKFKHNDHAGPSL